MRNRKRKSSCNDRAPAIPPRGGPDAVELAERIDLIAVDVSHAAARLLRICEGKPSPLVGLSYILLAIAGAISDQAEDLDRLGRGKRLDPRAPARPTIEIDPDRAEAEASRRLDQILHAFDGDRVEDLDHEAARAEFRAMPRDTLMLPGEIHEALDARSVATLGDVADLIDRRSSDPSLAIEIGSFAWVHLETEFNAFRDAFTQGFLGKHGSREAGGVSHG